MGGLELVYWGRDELVSLFWWSCVLVKFRDLTVSVSPGDEAHVHTHTHAHAHTRTHTPFACVCPVWQEGGGVVVGKWCDRENNEFLIIHTRTHNRSEVDPDSPLQEAEARRLFEGMLQALSDVRSVCACVC